jgi:ATP-binding cassette subfamily C (CFTR/MRP) protein 1
MSLVVLGALQVAQLAILAESKTPKTRASYSFAAFSLVGTVFFGLLSHLEHFRALQPSALLDVYFVVSLLLDCARTRTLWAIADAHDIAVISIVMLLVKLCIVILESQGKAHLFKPIYDRPSKEGSGGIFDRAFFWWLNHLLVLGYRKSLVVEDLTKVDDALVSNDLLLAMKLKWKSCTVANLFVCMLCYAC